MDIKPAEIIDQRNAGLITTEQMMGKLMHWRYTVGGVVRISGVATDVYMTGDWDAIELAFYRGQLSDEEFQQLADRQRDAPFLDPRAQVAAPLTDLSAPGSSLHRDSDHSTARLYPGSMSHDEVYAHACLVWVEEVARTWLESANAFLSGARPLDVLQTEGAVRVLEALDAEMWGGAA